MKSKIIKRVNEELDKFYETKSFGTIVLISKNEVAKWKYLYKEDIERLKIRIEGILKNER